MKYLFLLLLLPFTAHSQTFLTLDGYKNQLSFSGGYEYKFINGEAGLRTHFNQPATEAYLAIGATTNTKLWVSGNAGIAWQGNQVKQDRHVVNGTTVYNWKGTTSNSLIVPTFNGRVGYKMVYLSVSATGKYTWYGIGLKFKFENTTE